VRAASEAYRTSLARSLEAARRHDQLRQRLHAAESARTLVRLLFEVEGRAAPGVDGLPDALADLEAAQDWPAGYLAWALLNLVRDPTPKRQLELARRVERLLAARGLGGEDASLEELEALSVARWQVSTGVLRRAR
jgi:hypothetical protein